jgi:ACR3 family arsenite efflux pump ArsB
MNITNLLDASYWFAVYTPPLRRSSFIIVVVILVAFFVAGIVLKHLAKKVKNNPPLSRGLRKIAKPLFLFSLLGLLLTWFRQVGAGILSARAWTLLIFITALIWFVVILRDFLKTHQAEYNRFKEEQKYKEYFPKKK